MSESFLLESITARSAALLFLKPRKGKLAVMLSLECEALSTTQVGTRNIATWSFSVRAMSRGDSGDSNGTMLMLTAPCQPVRLSSAGEDGPLGLLPAGGSDARAYPRR